MNRPNAFTTIRPLCGALLVSAALLALDMPSARAAEPAAANSGPSGAVQVHDRTAFTYRVPRGALSPDARARRASEVLRDVIDDRVEGDPAFDLHGDEAQFRIGGRPLFVVTAEDAAAEGETSLERFAAQRRQGLESFLRAERRRAVLQHVTLSVSLAVFLGFISFLLIRRLRRWSRQARVWVDSSEQNAASGLRRLFADEKMRWAGLVLMHGLSFFAQAAVIYLFLLGTFSLFDRTQPWREHLTRWATAPLLAVAERVSTSIPTLLLLFLLLVIVQAGWHAINITSERIAGGRLAVRSIPPEMVPSARLLARAGLLLIALLVLAPVLTGHSADVFTRIGFLVLQALGLALLPLLAAVALGLYAVLSRRYPHGARIEVGGEASGTIASVDLLQVKIVTDAGPVLMPHLLLLVRPLRVLSSSAALSVDVPVPTALGAAWALQRLEAAVNEFALAHKLPGPVEVTLEELGLEAMRFRANVGPAPSTLRSALLLSLAAALTAPGPLPAREARSA